ncbi:phage tail protein [Aeromonas salmonicida]|uniref:phage tail-collar fiber domain-containing protein n=1 Tax=Aeromonas salmonicida TaxID=645 RepID=UPI0022402DF8|nr:phage tail protein [Aeromonas salmonicida]MDF8328327.1 phage tail protein [Aeromonas salmonicida]
MSQIITNAFANYLQACLTNQTPVVLDEFVLANIPGLDPSKPISPDQGLPPAGQIVHRRAVDQRGRINNDAVAYTIVMDTTVGDFSFNALYLINKATGVVGMIVHKGLETKLKTNEATGQTGNSLVKSMLMEYDRAPEATATHVDASTWQIDYAARLRGMDDDLRLQALQFFGPATFYGNGFNLVNESGVYKVQPGVAYVGGLRAQLDEVKKVTPGAKPVGLWLDIYRAGSLLDAWVNHFTLTLSVPDLVDYRDANGHQHHVAKVAIINANGSVTDVRHKRTIELTGDVTGKGILEDAQGVSIAVEIKDGSHRHKWGELDQVPATASRWPSWAEVTSKPDLAAANHTHPGTLTNPIPLAKEDLNTLITPSVYRQDSDANAALVLNYPEPKSGSLTVTAGAGVQHRYHVYNTSRVYTRAQYNTGAFTPWAREYNTQNKPTLAELGAAAASHAHPWSQITGVPVHATRWPTWAEVSGKPATMPPAAHTHPWAQVTGAPATATRWPAWGEVTGKPATMPPAAHTHTAAQGNADVVAGGVGQIGTYGFFYTQPSGAYAPGRTLPGSSLRWSSTDMHESDGGGGSPAGTWKLMGYYPSNAWTKSLWIRIA